MFRTTLQVAHIDQKHWRLTQPLIWQGRWEYFIIREDFTTDFASIPKPVRWLLDNAGRNSEAAVLHDAAWREAKRKTGSRIDSWHADGIFRRALRQTGTPALTRALMWFAVRLVATLGGRFGKLGPSLPVKILQLIGIFLLGTVTALGPTIVAAGGLVVYWVASWLVSLVWSIFERSRMDEPTNWPWPADTKSKRVEPPARELLMVVPEDEMPLALLKMLSDGHNVSGAQLDEFFEVEHVG